MGKYKLKKGLTDKRKFIEDEFKKFVLEGRVEFITFHPSYSYEEFVEGITVETEEEGENENRVSYKLKPGVFKRLCSRALNNVLVNNGIVLNVDLEKKCWKKLYEKYIENEKEIDWKKSDIYVIVIDEINRGEVSRILGELITLIETDKRLGADNQITATLPYSGDKFGVPKNVFIIGTMNTADRSISLVDTALRRRFDFREMPPREDIALESYEGSGKGTLLYKSVQALKKINEIILELEFLGKDKRIGHSFFFKGTEMDDNDIYNSWTREIFPLLEEYFYERFELLQKTMGLGDSVIDPHKGFKKSRDSVDELLDKFSAESNV